MNVIDRDNHGKLLNVLNKGHRKYVVKVYEVETDPSLAAYGTESERVAVITRAQDARQALKHAATLIGE